MIMIIVKTKLMLNYLTLVFPLFGKWSSVAGNSHDIASDVSYARFANALD